MSVVRLTRHPPRQRLGWQRHASDSICAWVAAQCEEIIVTVVYTSQTIVSVVMEHIQPRYSYL